MSDVRTSLHDKSLLYLLSFDAEVDLERDLVGFVPGGVRINIRSRPDRSRAYHVMRSRTLAGLGYSAITGTVRSGGDWVFWREDDVEYSEIRMSIETDDGATITCNYKVVADLIAGGYRKFIGPKGKLGTFKKPLDAALFMTPSLHSSNPKYAWINELFCVGYGVVRVIKSEFHRVSYDIYALT